MHHGARQQVATHRRPGGAHCPTGGTQGMRALLMKTPLLTRLEELEKKRALALSVVYRIGVVKSLPKDFNGERHLAMVKRGDVRHNVEWCEFEERPGPGPVTHDD